MQTDLDDVKSTCNIMLICGDEKQSKNSKCWPFSTKSYFVLNSSFFVF